MATATYIVKVPDRPTMAPVTFTADDHADAATLREQARVALRARMPGAHDFRDGVAISVYRDDNHDGTAQDSERLGLNQGGNVGTWNAGNGVNRFSNPFSINMRPESGDVVRGMVVGSDGNAITQVAGDDAAHPWVLPSDVQAALRRLDFSSDGVNGRSREESLRYVREFERIFRGRTFRFGTPPRDVTGADLMRRVINEGRANMGPTEGTDTMSAVYTAAGVDPSHPGGYTDADFARFLDNPGLSTDPGAAPQDSSIGAFLSNPNTETASRLRADKARTDELLRILMAALASGNTDVLPMAFELVARNGRGTVAQLAMNTIQQLQRVDEHMADINTRVQGLDMGSSDANVRARAGGQLQQANVELTTWNNQRQPITQMLQSALQAMEEENRTSQKIADAYRTAHMRGVG